MKIHIVEHQLLSPLTLAHTFRIPLRQLKCEVDCKIRSRYYRNKLLRGIKVVFSESIPTVDIVK